MPVGWTDRQGPGWYRLEKRTDEAYFGFAVGPHSWKQFLFTPEQRLWTARRSESGIEFPDEPANAPKRAFIGVRACELHAIAIQDRVFVNRNELFTDPHYDAARDNTLLIAIECTQAGDTCFCASMGTGPEVRLGDFPSGLAPADSEKTNGTAGRIPLPIRASVPTNPRASCDLVMTELDEVFVIRSASAAGERILGQLMLANATVEDVNESRRRVATATQTMGRKADMNDVKALLHRNQEHPRWDEVAKRCLSCTNCTMVCPTCFCSGVEDHTDLTGETAEHVRKWDSCFNPDFAAVHGGNYRPSIRGRYRQWLTHKFASWFDQFGTSGCVGCGRCITWCPVGIDVTEEIAAIRQTDGQRREASP